jgi:hypothetical protein
MQPHHRLQQFLDGFGRVNRVQRILIQQSGALQPLDIRFIADGRDQQVCFQHRAVRQPYRPRATLLNNFGAAARNKF